MNCALIKYSTAVWQLPEGLHGGSNLLQLLLSALRFDLVQARLQFGNDFFVIPHCLVDNLRSIIIGIQLYHGLFNKQLQHYCIYE